MRVTLLFLLYLILAQSGQAQKIAIGTDKTNILYIGVDNPLTIAAANVSQKSLVVKADIGSISGGNGSYIYNGKEAGRVIISVYTKSNGKLKKLGDNYFRVKKIPDPVFKIASGKDSIPVVEFQNQKYVRAELENFEIETRILIISFKAIVISKDTCKYKEILNTGNEIGDSLKHEFQLLKKGEIVIFKEILVHGLDGQQFIKPRTFFLY